MEKPLERLESQGRTAIGAGADVAIEAADITLVSGELTKVVQAIHLSRSTFGKIVQNLFWAAHAAGVAAPGGERRPPRT